MNSQTVFVPLGSPAWQSYRKAGWVERWRTGAWVVMTHP